MKNIKKLTAILLAVCCILSLTACAGGKTESTTAATTAAPADTTAATTAAATTEAAAEGFTTANEGVLTMATNAQFPPYEFYEGSDIVGIDAEIAGAIAAKLGLTLQIEDMEFDSTIEAVKSGKADIAMAGMTVTPQREEEVNFTASYATGVQVIIVAEDSEITSVDDLFAEGANFVIGVQRNTTGDLYTTWDLEDEGLATIDRYSKGADAVQALKTGKVDCVVIDNEPAKAFVAEVEGLKILETEYIEEMYAGAMSKDNEALYTAVSTALEELIADGTVQGIIDKYIAADEASEPAETTAAAPEFTTANEGTLTMATNAQFPPYEFYEGSDIVGIDAEIAGAVAEKLGLTLQIEDMEFDSIIEAVKTGKADIGMAGMTVTPEREEEVNFTASYATGKQVIIVAEDSKIASVDDLFAEGANFVIGVQRNTTGDLYTTWDLEDEGLATIDRYSKGADAVQALKTGKVDCVVIDNEPAKAFVAEVEGLKILETEYVEEMYAGAMSKDNEGLYAAVSAALDELIADGIVQAIVDKYIAA